MRKLLHLSGVLCSFLLIAPTLSAQDFPSYSSRHYEHRANVLTQEGIVSVSGSGESVEVKAGYATVVIPGQPPTKPVRFDENLDFDVPRVRLNANGIWEVEGKVDPLNFLWIDDEYISLNEDGSFQVNYAELPPGLVAIRLQTPLGTTKTTFTFLREEPFPIQLRGEEDEFPNAIEW